MHIFIFPLLVRSENEQQGPAKKAVSMLALPCKSIHNVLALIFLTLIKISGFRFHSYDVLHY